MPWLLVVGGQVQGSSGYAPGMRKVVAQLPSSLTHSLLLCS